MEQEKLVRVRMAQPSDAADLLGIYEYYIKNTPVTFEFTVPSVEEFAGRIRNTLSHMPYLVCEIDGKIVGYAYASLYRSRAAYDWDCELSVYLEEDYHRGGIGKMLYRLLFALLEQMHYRHAYACITSPNPESIDFHAAMGFQHVAFFPACGYKDGKWHDIVWMDYVLEDSQEPPLPVTPIGQVDPAFIDEIFREAEKELEERLNGDMMICKAFMGL